MTCKEKTKIYSVTEITWAIKSQLEDRYNKIYVQGEISNFKKQSSGHIYFSLKDKDAQISCALFRNAAKRLDNLPKEGDKIVVFGEISVYPPRGNYQIIVRDIRHLGLGELLLKLHDLKKELKNLGWFDQTLKKKLPAFPKRIGVITSPTGAVIQDILNILTRRYTNFHLLLNPVKVQGEKAYEEIAQAIDDMNKYDLADVIIVGRGGGSLEDLWPFNEKNVAKSIYESKIPIISAVGHETDYSISDFAADMRAPTPSAAAEIVVQEKEALIKNLKSVSLQMIKFITNHHSNFKNQLLAMKKQPVFSFSYHLTGQKIQQIDEMKTKLEMAICHFIDIKKHKSISFRKHLGSLNPSFQLSNAKEKLQKRSTRLEISWSHYFKIKREKIDKKTLQGRFCNFIKQLFDTKKRTFRDLASHIKSIDPKNLLKKGYSILFSEKDDSIILSCHQVEKKQKIYALVSDGKIKAITEEIEKS